VGRGLGDARVQDVAAKALACFPDRARKVRFFEGTAESIEIAVPLGASLVAFVDGDHARASVEATLRPSLASTSAPWRYCTTAVNLPSWQRP
jgi:hypothetical protein